MATESRVSAQAVALASAMAALLFTVPLAAAWFVWHFGGHKPTARNIVFFGTLAALAIFLFTRAARESSDRLAAAKEHAQLLAHQLVDREINGAIAPRSDGFRNASAPEHSSSVAQAIMAAQRATKSRHDAVQLKYDEASAAIPFNQFFDLKLLGSIEALAQRRTAVEAFATANRALLEAGTLSAFQLSVELRDRGVPEDAVSEAIAVYRSATKKHLPRLKELRDHDGARVLLMKRFLDFAAKQHGKWRVDSGNGEIHFQDPKAKDEFADITRTAAVLQAEGERLRRELRGGKK